MHDYDTQRQQMSDCPSKIPPRTYPKSRLNNGNQDFYYSLTINQLYNMTNDTAVTSMSEQQNMGDATTLRYFTEIRQQEPETSVATTAIRTLLDIIKRSSAGTLSELTVELKSAVQLLITHTDSSIPSVKSGCELFLRFITLATFDTYGIDECRQKLVERGQVFLQRTLLSRQRISEYSQEFIVDGSIILTHSYSRVVLALLKYASKFTRFRVFVSQSEPDKSGLKMRDELEAIGIPSICILDASVAYMMEQVTLVLIGAEAVVESGGIINKIGTFNMAIAAHEMNKPFYVAVESFKFVRFYPLNNRDLPDDFKYKSSTIARLGKVNLTNEHPLVDYTPPAYITLLFTDIGPLTPSAVSDELIKLYI